MVPLTAAMVPVAPGSVVRGAVEPDGRAAVVGVVDAPDDPPQAANASPATPTTDSAATVRLLVRRLAAGAGPVVVVGLWSCMVASFVVLVGGGR